MWPEQSIADFACAEGVVVNLQCVAFAQRGRTDDQMSELCLTNGTQKIITNEQYDGLFACLRLTDQEPERTIASTVSGENQANTSPF
jgi:hypothetical protein